MKNTAKIASVLTVCLQEGREEKSATAVSYALSTTTYMYIRCCLGILFCLYDYGKCLSKAIGLDLAPMNG